jgi:WD40 repeat protein
MRNNRSNVFLLQVLLGLVACSTTRSGIGSIAPTKANRPTNSIASTQTAPPMLTPPPTLDPEDIGRPIPTPTSIPDLHSAGPYLFLHNTAYEPDGSGMQTFNPPEGYLEEYSPDWHWYAYVSEEGDAEEGYASPDNQVLRVCNLFTGEDREVARLAPADYIERQQKMTNEFKQEFMRHGYNPENEINVEAAVANLGFWQAWSPDSRYLAFSAIIDGYSSDVYVYDVDSGEIKRKDADKLNVGYITWSPDGQWIEYLNWMPARMFIILMSDDWTPTPTRFVRLDPPSENRTIPQTIEKWISPNELLIRPYYYQDGGDPGGRDLYLYILSSGTTRLIWKGWWHDYAIDPTNMTIILSAEDPCETRDCFTQDSGIYFGSLKGGKLIRIADGRSYNLEYRGGSVHEFLDLTDGVKGISYEGKIDSLPYEIGNAQVSLSPDYRWAALFGYFGNNGLLVLDENDQAVFQIKNNPVYSLAWRTNGQDLFVMNKNQIQYLSINSLQISPLIDCLPNSCNEYNTMYFPPAAFLSSLTTLRVQAPSFIEKTRGTSLWSKAAFRDLPEPGIQEYSVDIPAYSSWRWDFSWCAKSQVGLEAILGPLELEFRIGGEKIGEDIFRIYDSPKGGRFCRTWATMLSGWQPGDVTDLEIRYTLREAINDGTQGYPAGEYRQINHITVAE